MYYYVTNYYVMYYLMYYCIYYIDNNVIYCDFERMNYCPLEVINLFSCKDVWQITTASAVQSDLRDVTLRMCGYLIIMICYF